MKTQIKNFGKIYNRNNPTYGVYVLNSLNVPGWKPIAISHHWSERSAKLAAEKETKLRQVYCVAIKFAK